MAEPSEFPLENYENRIFVENVFVSLRNNNHGVVLAEASSESDEDERSNPFECEVLPESEESDSSTDGSARHNDVNRMNEPPSLVDDHISETSSESEIQELNYNAELDFIPESKPSESDANQSSQHSSTSLPTYEGDYEDIEINETPESSENGTNEGDGLADDILVSETSSEGQIDDPSSILENEIIMETDLSDSDVSADDIQSLGGSQHSLQDDEIISETESGDNDDENDTIIPESSNESEDESDSASNQIPIQNIPPTPIPPLPTFNAHVQMVNASARSIESNAQNRLNDPVSTAEQVQRIEPNSNITEDEIIPETDSEASSSEIFEMMELPNRDEIQTSPLYNNDLPLVLPDRVGSPLNNNENEPIGAIEPDDQIVNENQNPPNIEDDDDDDETIMMAQPAPIEISVRSREIIERIERFIVSAVDDLQNGRRLQIVVQNRRNWDNCFIENERFILLPITEARCRHIRSTFCLSVIFFLLAEIHELLSTNRRCTVRELYYKDVNITQKQENVNEALKTICCLLDAAPWELGVLSTSKGLIAGPLEIYLPENVIVNCNIDKNGITLPHLTSGIIDLRTTATHILVVEKDTVFKKLLDCNILERWNQRCILITGKGYPDTNTRLILNKLRELHALPIDIVTDADPYGVEIMLTYRHGSMAMSNLAEALAVPSVRWLGIFPSDIHRFGIRAIQMSDEDRRKLDNMLNRPFINDHVHRELLIMKQANLKAEIEAISDSSCTYLIDVYLRNKIDNNNGI